LAHRGEPVPIAHPPDLTLAQTPSEEEWDAFLAHFEKRKVSIGTCAPSARTEGPSHVTTPRRRTSKRVMFQALANNAIVDEQIASR
jgi:hypothetical protein